MFTINRNANVRTAYLKIKNLDSLTKRTIRATFYDIGKTLVKDAKELINKKPKTGHVYKKYMGLRGRLKNPKYYTASAPGEAPAVVTGELRKSINFTVGTNQMIFGLDTSGGKGKYGKFLEYGNLIGMSGQGSKNIKPRPFISASYAKNKSNIMTKFGNAVEQAIKK